MRLLVTRQIRARRVVSAALGARVPRTDVIAGNNFRCSLFDGSPMRNRDFATSRPSVGRYKSLVRVTDRHARLKPDRVDRTASALDIRFVRTSTECRRIETTGCSRSKREVELAIADRGDRKLADIAGRTRMVDVLRVAARARHSVDILFPVPVSRAADVTSGIDADVVAVGWRLTAGSEIR